MEGDVVPCRHKDGSHRAIAPRETVARVWPLAPVMGITRLADVTGLDNIGIPVVMSCRPNARSLAVSQGKGTTLDAARASALMEAVELFHAEHVTLPLRLGSYEELRYTHRVVDIATLPRSTTTNLDLGRPILWAPGHAAGTGEGTLVPFEMVHTVYVPDVPLPQTGCLSMSSSGLASGNHVVEAVSHAVCELVERDATAIFALASKEQRSSRRVDLDSIDDSTCQALLERFRAADVLVAVWELTSDVRLPVFAAKICDRDPLSPRGLFGAMGIGCHVAREVALSRALTEAAQSRLTFISGARDDMSRGEFRTVSDADARDRLRDDVTGNGQRAFAAAPSFSAETVNEELAHAERVLAAAGFAEIVVVDLAKPELRIPVVRALVPGLEGNVEDGVACLGPNAASRLAAALHDEEVRS